MKVGKLRVGTLVDVLARQGTPLWYAGVREGWVRVEVVDAADDGFKFRTLDRSPPIVGIREFDGLGKTWKVPSDQREAQGYYGFDRGRVLLVGEAPNRWMQETGKMGHCLARKDLADLCGVGFPDPFVRLFARTNVLGEWPGRAGKGSAFPAERAKTEASRLARRWGHLDTFSKVVLLGRRTAGAFDLAGIQWFQWTVAPWFRGPDFGSLDGRRLLPHQKLGRTVAVVPHPSKVSTWWNEAANVVAARKFWSALADFAAQHAGVKLLPVSKVTIAATIRTSPSLSPGWKALVEEALTPVGPPVEGSCEGCGVDVLWDPGDPSTMTPQCGKCGTVLCSKKCFREHGKCDGKR